MFSAGCVAAIQYFEQAVVAWPDSGQRAPVVEKPCTGTSREDVSCSHDIVAIWGAELLVERAVALQVTGVPSRLALVLL